MVLQCEQQQIKSLLIETVSMLCKGALKFHSKMTIEGLIGITLDDHRVVLINIQDTHHKQSPDPVIKRESDEASSRSPSHPPHKMRKTGGATRRCSSESSVKAAASGHSSPDSKSDSSMVDISSSDDQDCRNVQNGEPEDVHPTQSSRSLQNEKSSVSQSAHRHHWNQNSTPGGRKRNTAHKDDTHSSKTGVKGTVVIKQEVVSGEELSELNQALQMDCNSVPEASNIANLEKMLTSGGALSNYSSDDGNMSSSVEHVSQVPVPSMLFASSDLSSWEPSAFPSDSFSQLQRTMDSTSFELSTSSHLGLPQNEQIPVFPPFRVKRRPVLYDILSECPTCCNLYNLYQKWFPDNYGQMVDSCSGSTLRQRLSRARKRQLQISICEHCSAKYTSARHS